MNRHRSAGPRILWSFSPFDLGLAPQFDAVVYHSVDLLHHVPGVPRGATLEAERRMIEAADVVIASSEGVARHLRAQGASEPLLWENVADTEIFESTGTQPRRAEAIFAGHLTEEKIDLRLLLDLAESDVPLVLAGPVAVDGTSAGVMRQLLDHPNVRYLGNLSLLDLADAIRACQVALIPYLINEYTVGVFPMKVYEYLAAGTPVVSTALPSLVGKSIDGLSTVERADYVAAVGRAVSSLESTYSRRIAESAKQFSWVNRVAAANELLDGLVARGGADATSG